MESRVRLAALVLVVLVACTPGDGTPQGARTGPAETDGDVAPARTDLIVGTPADTFVTEGERANLGMFPINANIFETLVSMTPDFQIEPGLAERWEYRGDNTWRFHLRDDVTFHDGQPFTAEAVKFSFDRLAQGAGARLGIGPESTQVVDELTVDVTTTEPNLRLPDQLVHPSLGPIVAPGSEVGVKPTGTGSFRFVEYVPGERLVVERNDDYWGQPARLDRITFRFVPDGQARWLSLRTGEVDLIYDLSRELLPEVERASGTKLAVTPPGAAEIMFLNRSGAEPYTILADPQVRQAVGHAIDRDTVVEQIWPGAAEVGNTVTPAALFGEHASLVDGPNHDPERARALLDEAGWVPGPDGIRVKDERPLLLTMINGYPPIDLRKPMPELVQSQLGEVGIGVEIVETPELGTYTDRLETGQGDIFLERVSQNDANPSFFAAAFWYSQAEGPYSDWFAAGPRFDAAVEASLAAEDRDEATREAAEAIHRRRRGGRGGPRRRGVLGVRHARRPRGLRAARLGPPRALGTAALGGLTPVSEAAGRAQLRGQIWLTPVS